MIAPGELSWPAGVLASPHCPAPDVFLDRAGSFCLCLPALPVPSRASHSKAETQSSRFCFQHLLCLWDVQGVQLPLETATSHFGGLKFDCGYFMLLIQLPADVSVSGRPH